MGYLLSILDKSPVNANEHPTQALKNTLALAQKAEQWGYHRFWLAEHHNTQEVAISSPEVAIAWIAAHTKHIRVGSGGVMLQHYSPYKVAENFNLLASLAPGRIDLGVGKAPGGLPLSTRALQDGVDSQKKGDFPAQLKQLNTWLHPHVDTTEKDTLFATPLPHQPASGFLLGASEQSAELAASLGWGFVFAAHLNADPDTIAHSLELYHQQLHGRRAILAVPVIVAHTSEEADTLAGDRQQYRVTADNGQKVTVGSIEQAEAYIRQSSAATHKIEERQSTIIKGTAEQVHAQLAALQKQYGVEEFVIDTPLADPQARSTSLELLAAWQLSAHPELSHAINKRSAAATV